MKKHHFARNANIIKVMGFVAIQKLAGNILTLREIFGAATEIEKKIQINPPDLSQRPDGQEKPQ